MTELIISHEYNLQFAYLLTYLNKLLDSNITSLSQIYTKSDIHIINKTPTESIGIDDVKMLIKSLYFYPMEYKYQTGIIFYSQNLTIEAQNSLLKSLEEQPEKTAYILLVNNERNLLATIVSRCNKHFVTPKNFENEIIKMNEDITDDVKHIEIKDFVNKPLVEQLLAVEKVEELEKETGGEYMHLLNEIIKYYRTEQLNQVRLNNYSTQTISKNLELVNTAIKRIKANTNKRATFENLLIQISQNEDDLL